MTQIIDIFKQAEKQKRAIAQFNISDLQGLKASVETAKNFRVPLIIGVSEGERDFFGINQLISVVKSFKNEFKIDIFLSADHSKSFETAKQAIDEGFDYIHFDGSTLPFEENIEITRKVVKYAKSKRYFRLCGKKIMIEGELGYLKGASKIQETVEISPSDFTKPEEAIEFIKKTGVDSLAIVFGNFHGIASKIEERLDLERLKQIKKAVSKTFLVLHGGSGINGQDIKEAIKIGIRKININTEIRIAYINALKEFLNNNPKETTPYKIFSVGINAMKKVMEDKLKLFGWQ